MPRARSMLYFFLPALALIGLFDASLAVAQATSATSTLRPNILWVTSEDNGQELGCYGDTFASSPNIDALAERGMRYTNCWSNAPVCAPARTTLVSGLYPTSLGAQHMRSQVALPELARLYPEVLREAGYYCTNNSKEDYNLETPKGLWDESSNKAHWRNRKAGQPFFAVFNFTVSHESRIRDRPHTLIHDPAGVTVPPYHPDTPEVRRDWAQYYDRVTEMDREVGRILQQLKDDGLADNTIVFYYGDHGCGMPRGKRWLYQSGLRVPLVVHVPERLRQLAGEQYSDGSVNERLVSFVDMFPTVLSLLGTRPASYLQGHAFLGKYTSQEPRYVYGFRDRMDERYDMSRAVRDRDYLYIRNFYPHRPQGTYLDYMFQTPTTRVWKQMFDEGKLNAEQSVFWLPKPAEELYDLAADPYQIANLADSSEHQETVERLRGAVQDWMLDIKDLGFLPEGEMLERSADGAPYDLGRDPERYPIESIHAAADLASRSSEGDLERLLEQRVARDSTVRYWVANGLLIRAVRDQDRAAAVKAARGMTTDPSPYTRSVANEVMARFGSDSERGVAINALLKDANTHVSNTFAAMAALNALDWVEPTKKQIGDSLGGLPPTHGPLPSRYNSYIPRLVERVESIAK